MREKNEMPKNGSKIKLIIWFLAKHFWKAITLIIIVVVGLSLLVTKITCTREGIIIEKDKIKIKKFDSIEFQEENCAK